MIQSRQQEVIWTVDFKRAADILAGSANGKYGIFPAPSERDVEITQILRDFVGADSAAREWFLTSLTEDRANTLCLYSERMADLARQRGQSLSDMAVAQEKGGFAHSRNILADAILAWGIARNKTSSRDHSMVLELRQNARILGEDPNTLFAEAIASLDEPAAKSILAALKELP